MIASFACRTALAALIVFPLFGAQTALGQQQQRPPAQQPRAPAAAPAPAPAPQQPQAPAAQPLPPKGAEIVIVDSALVDRHSLAVLAIRTQDERQRQALQNEGAKLEADLKTADQELQRQRAILSPEAYTQRRRDFEKRVNDAQQSVNTRRRDLDDAMNVAYSKVQASLLEVIAELAKENDYKLVLARSQITMLYQNSIDVTGEVIQRLNKKLPTMAVQVAPRK
jgi:Skp family chaperone for outer membrane proteins